MMKYITLALLSILFLGSTAFGFADVTEFGVSARPLGMGRAYVGRRGDVAGITLNPASIAGVDGFKFSSMSGTLMSEVGLLAAAAAYPTDFGDIGGAYIATSLAGLNITRITGGTVEVIGSTSFLNNALMLTYAPRLEDLTGVKGLRAAASLKLFNQGFSNQSGDLAGGTASGMDMDLGAQYDINGDVTLGMSVLNALPASMGGKITWQKGGVDEGIPAVMKFGALSRIGENINLALGLDMSPQYKIPGAWHLGGEYTPFEYLALRAGIDQKSTVVGVDNNLTLGLGFFSGGFSFDYAYHQYGALEENTTHYVSISYVGDEPFIKKEKAAELPPAPEPLPPPPVVVTPETKVVQPAYHKVEVPTFDPRRVPQPEVKKPAPPRPAPRPAAPARRPQVTRPQQRPAPAPAPAVERTADVIRMLQKQKADAQKVLKFLEIRLRVAIINNDKQSLSGIMQEVSKQKDIIKQANAKISQLKK